MTTSGPCRVVSAVMQKGGVGKTTTVLNLARAASVQGLRVLVLDLDPQGNTTSTLTLNDLPEDQVSIADAIVPKPDVAMGEVLVPTIWNGVDLAPVTSTEALTEAEDRISAAKTGREYRVAESVAPLRDGYDLVLIDNAPALGLLVINALVAADRALVVMESDEWSEDGLAELRTTVNGVQQYTNQALEWAGVVISRWRGTADERARLAEITEHFTEAPVWSDKADLIPLWSDIKTTLNAGKGLDQTRQMRLQILAEAYGRFVQRLVSTERLEAVDA